MIGNTFCKDHDFLGTTNIVAHFHISTRILGEKFSPAEARRLLDRLKIHYMPKHASWLNIAEIELRVLSGQCLNHRISDKKNMAKEIGAWQKQRNFYQATVDW